MSSQWPPPDGSPAPHSPGSAPSAAPDPGTFPPPRSAYEQPLQGQAYPPGPPPQWAPPPPRHLADQPPSPPPSRGGGGAAWLGLVGVIGVVLVGLVVSFTPASLDGLLPGRTGQATTSPAPNADSSTKQPNDPGSGSSSSPTMPAKPEAVLKKNPIYALKVPANCPSQSAPSSRAAFRTQVKALLACENKVWRKALAGTAVTFSQPKVVFYGTRTSSPCGTLGDTYPAAYCTSNNTLYFATAAYAQGRYYRLAVAQFVMHEYAHHVQNLAGLFAAEDAMDEKAAVTTRRIELQAHCLSYYQLTHSDLGFSDADRADAEYQFSYTSDAKGHGSVAAEQYWGRRGMAASKIGACNTWKVAPGAVK